MIWKVKENEVVWLSNLSLGDLPDQLPNGINVHLKKGQVGVEAQGLVGAIPMPGGDTLQIVPKVGQVNFLRLLFRAEGAQRNLEREYDEFVEYSLEFEESIDSIVARQLMECLAEIMRLGPRQGRVGVKKFGQYIEGNVDLPGTALRMSCHKPDPVSLKKKIKTVDIPENRVLTEAAIRAWQWLEGSSKELYLKVFEGWLKRFPRSKALDGDLDFLEKGFASGRFGGPRAYYIRALMLSRVILGNSGLGFRGATSVQGDAVLLNTASIFEGYIRNVISASYMPLGYVVSKGGVGSKSLYIDGSFELIPDIVISKGSRDVLIVDAKYKKPSAGDHYQMHAYLRANNMKVGMLIAPSFDGGNVKTVDYLAADKTLVREVYLPMENLKESERFLESLLSFVE